MRQTVNKSEQNVSFIRRKKKLFLVLGVKRQPIENLSLFLSLSPSIVLFLFLFPWNCHGTYRTYCNKIAIGQVKLKIVHFRYGCKMYILKIWTTNHLGYATKVNTVGTKQKGGGSNCNHWLEGCKSLCNMQKVKWKWIKWLCLHIEKGQKTRQQRRSADDEKISHRQCLLVVITEHWTSRDKTFSQL